MFSVAVSVGTRLKDWNTKPIRSRRSLVSPASSRVPTSSPPTNVCPDVGRSSPAMQCMSVDLPEPDGPMTAVNRPWSKVTVIPARACTATWPTPYVLVRATECAAGTACVCSVNPADVGSMFPLGILKRQLHLESLVTCARPPGCVLPLLSTVSVATEHPGAHRLASQFPG